MTSQDKVLIDEPVPGFDLADMFMSRTDLRGVISAGNQVFQRLSGYEWERLIGAPHRIIRHPDMPKAAFHLMWSEIREGRPFGAYVKNRAACGRYYWVYAVVVPIEEGYLSVRLKPSTTYLDEISALYDTVRLAERNDGIKPEEGIETLQKRLRANGFRGYHDFMTQALGAEVAKRSDSLGHGSNVEIEQFAGIDALLRELSAEVARVTSMFDDIGNSANNLSIFGSRLSVGADPFRVLAQNYGLLAEELQLAMERLRSGLSRVIKSSQEGRMGHAASLLYGEAIERFATEEPRISAAEHEDEMARLELALNRFSEQSQRGCERIRREVEGFSIQTNRFSRLLSGLSLTRVMCQIQSASVLEDTSSIDGVAHALSTFQHDLGASLSRISDGCSGVLARLPEKGQ